MECPTWRSKDSRRGGNHFGVGLSGMRERVNDLGGQFEIKSGGDGMTIAVSIPLATEKSDAGIGNGKTSAAQKPAA